MQFRFARLVVTLALVFGAVTVATACSSQSGTSGSQTGQSAPVPPAAFATAAHQPGTVVLDVRTPAEFRAGHLAGAVNIDVEATDFNQRLAGLDHSASYAVYCRTGHRSSVATAQMRAAGFTHVTELAGGITAWTAEGRPTVTG